LIRARTSRCIAGVLVATLASPAVAQRTSPTSDAVVQRLGDLAATLRLETETADALESNSIRRIEALKAKILKEDGMRPDALAKRLQGDATASSKLNACHFAALTLRSIVVGLAEGRNKAFFEDEFWSITPGGVSTIYAEHVGRCEVLGQAPKSERKIGRDCLRVGSCPRV
jgi:hypothetical protein